MAFQIVLNIILASVWVLLQDNHTFLEFTIGYFIGLGILFLLRRFFTADFYFRRVTATLKLIILFISELTLSNIEIAKIVLSPKLDFCPGIIAVPTELKTDWEVSLLASLISLTPGTLSMAFSNDSKIIYVHAINVPDRDEKVKQIKSSFEKAIMEVTH